MELFDEYLERIGEPRHRARMQEVLAWVAETFPELTPRIAWSQPMFTHHGTFIIGFSTAKNHLAIAPERAGIEHFSEDIRRAGYSHSQQLLRMEWDRSVDYALLEALIRYNLEDKTACTTFWRP